MALIVEDGSGISNADAYVSTDTVDTYNTNYMSSATWSNASLEDKERAVRNATAFIDFNYGTDRGWAGYRTKDTQSLDWPRNYAAYTDGREISSTSLPVEIIQAACYLSIQAISSPLTSVLDPASPARKTYVKVGPIEEAIEYVGGGSTGEKGYPVADKLLRRLIHSEGVFRV